MADKVPNDAIEVAIAELQEMFPYHVIEASIHDASQGGEGTLLIFKGNTLAAVTKNGEVLGKGKTLAEAMEKVRKWKARTQ